MIIRHNGVRSAIGLGIVSVLAIGLLTGQSASAARTKTNYYNASVSTSTVRYASTASDATTVTFTIQNCGTAFAPPSNCANAKGSSIDSILITLPSGWSPATISASGLKLAPGASTQLSASVLPAVSTAGAPQSVSLCVSDTTQCSFQATNAALTLELPLRFVFTGQPADGTPASSICGTKVQLTDGFSPTRNVPLGGVSVSLAAASDSALDPGLDSTVTHLTDGPSGTSPGAATFGCTPEPAVGGPYKIAAVAQNAGASIPSADSNAFTVYSHFSPCGGGCNGTENGNGGTHLDVNSDATGDLGTSFFDAGNGQYPAFICAGVKKLDGRPDVLQATSNGNKTLVITWSKAVTLKFTDNGTPHWQVCMGAPVVFTTDAGVDATLNTTSGLYEGTVPLCGAAGLTGDDPCMVISRNAAQEIATITLPISWNGDPYFH